MRPLAIDLYAGLGGWTEGLLAEGWRVVGFDIERHRYPRIVRPESAEKLPGNNGGAGSKIWTERPIARLKDANDGLAAIENEWDEYPAQLVLQDVLTLDGAQFKDATLIVASPPCQEFSYMAMPWTRAKRIAAALRGQGEFPEGYRGSRTIPELTALFDACFRIQREASEAAGRRIPLVVENVRGACPWVGRSRWNFGSFHPWGDVPAVMPTTVKAQKVPGFRFDGSGRSFQTAAVEGQKQPWNGDPLDNPGGLAWFKYGYTAQCGSKSPQRKAASAAIAKIPYALALHIARAFKP